MRQRQQRANKPPFTPIPFKRAATSRKDRSTTRETASPATQTKTGHPLLLQTATVGPPLLPPPPSSFSTQSSVLALSIASWTHDEDSANMHRRTAVHHDRDKTALLFIAFSCPSPKEPLQPPTSEAESTRLTPGRPVCSMQEWPRTQVSQATSVLQPAPHTWLCREIWGALPGQTEKASPETPGQYTGGSLGHRQSTGKVPKVQLFCSPRSRY